MNQNMDLPVDFGAMCNGCDIDYRQKCANVNALKSEGVALPRSEDLLKMDPLARIYGDNRPKHSLLNEWENDYATDFLEDASELPNAKKLIVDHQSAYNIELNPRKRQALSTFAAAMSPAKATVRSVYPVATSGSTAVDSCTTTASDIKGEKGENGSVTESNESAPSPVIPYQWPVFSSRDLKRDFDKLKYQQLDPNNESSSQVKLSNTFSEPEAVSLSNKAFIGSDLESIAGSFSSILGHTGSSMDSISLTNANDASEVFSSVSAEEPTSDGVEKEKKVDPKNRTRLPITNISRIMKRTLPENAKVTRESKEMIQEGVTEFIKYIAVEASDRCAREKRKIINGDDVIWALEKQGFATYVDYLMKFLRRLREASSNSTSTGAKPIEANNKLSDAHDKDSSTSREVNGSAYGVSMSGPKSMLNRLSPAASNNFSFPVVRQQFYPGGLSNAGFSSPYPINGYNAGNAALAYSRYPGEPLQYMCDPVLVNANAALPPGSRDSLSLLHAMQQQQALQLSLQHRQTHNPSSQQRLYTVHTQQPHSPHPQPSHSQQPTLSQLSLSQPPHSQSSHSQQPTDSQPLHPHTPPITVGTLPFHHMHQRSFTSSQIPSDAPPYFGSSSQFNASTSHDVNQRHNNANRAVVHSFSTVPQPTFTVGGSNGPNPLYHSSYSTNSPLRHRFNPSFSNAVNAYTAPLVSVPPHLEERQNLIAGTSPHPNKLAAPRSTDGFKLSTLQSSEKDASV